jgi:hypothetical protein
MPLPDPNTASRKRGSSPGGRTTASQGCPANSAAQSTSASRACSGSEWKLNLGPAAEFDPVTHLADPRSGQPESPAQTRYRPPGHSRRPPGAPHTLDRSKRRPAAATVAAAPAADGTAPDAAPLPRRLCTQPGPAHGSPQAARRGSRPGHPDHDHRLDAQSQPTPFSACIGLLPTLGRAPSVCEQHPRRAPALPSTRQGSRSPDGDLRLTRRLHSAVSTRSRIDQDQGTPKPGRQSRLETRDWRFNSP